jgi:ATP-binding cassette subfamily F protein 3
LQKELQQVETQMQSLETQRHELHAQLASAQISVADLASHGQRLKLIEEELPSLEARWLELTELLEGTVAAK